MAAWESRRGHLLPRPAVLEGDLYGDHLGLDPAAGRWLAEHCDSVLHAAGSMSFVADENGEPRRTNVDGLARLLEFCCHAGIRRFHHVSTAYLCGLRQGRVLETELDEGQPLGNVYEESKLAAEKMLARRPFLDSLTVYRPASIVGDSQTGATTSYHGFYLPLQLAYAFSGSVPPEVMDQRFSTLLGLTGREGKNLVPVDWLSQAITYLVTHPQHHGRVYHLTHPRPTTVGMIQKMIPQAIRSYSKRPIADRVDPDELATYERLFHDQMLIYRSHWRDDPVFDRSNADTALAGLPCPEMDYGAFNAPRSLSDRDQLRPAPSRSGGARLRRGEATGGRLERAGRLGDGAADGSLDLYVSGPRGGQWRLLLRGGVPVGGEAPAAAPAPRHGDLTAACLESVPRVMSVRKHLQRWPAAARRSVSRLAAGGSSSRGRRPPTPRSFASWKS